MCLLPPARCVAVFARRLLSRSSTVLAPDPTPYPSIWNHVFGVIWIRSLAGLPTEPVWRSGNGVGLGECAGTSDLRFLLDHPTSLHVFSAPLLPGPQKIASRATVDNCRSGLSSTVPREPARFSAFGKRRTCRIGMRVCGNLGFACGGFRWRRLDHRCDVLTYPHGGGAAGYLGAAPGDLLPGPTNGSPKS